MNKLEQAYETRKNAGASFKTVILAASIILGVFVFQQLASLAGGRAADALNSRALDPDGAFIWISIHHLAQIAITLPVICLLGRLLNIDFHLKPRFNASGARLLLLFSAVMCVYAVLYYIVGSRLGLLIPFGYPSNPRNILGTLGFQLLLSGPSEELIFRALPITLLSWVFRGAPKRRAGFCIVVSAVLFSIAHINWYTDPFRLSFYWYQLGYAFALGLLYGISYVKRGTVLYPMLLHSLSNVIVIGGGYLFYALV